MESLGIKAEWKRSVKKMTVTLQCQGQTYIESFTKRQWKRFIRGIKEGETLRLGGLVIYLTNDTDAKVATGIRIYLLQVDYAFRATGQTDFLKNDANI